MGYADVGEAVAFTDEDVAALRRMLDLVKIGEFDPVRFQAGLENFLAQAQGPASSGTRERGGNVFGLLGLFPGGRLVDHAVLLLNPFYHLLTVARAPLLGEAVAPITYVGLSIMAVVGWIATFAAFANIRRRIVHYL